MARHNRGLFTPFKRPHPSKLKGTGRIQPSGSLGRWQASPKSTISGCLGFFYFFFLSCFDDFCSEADAGSRGDHHQARSCSSRPGSGRGKEEISGLGEEINKNKPSFGWTPPHPGLNRGCSRALARVRPGSAAVPEPEGKRLELSDPIKHRRESRGTIGDAKRS